MRKVSYEDFRTGLTYRDVFWMLWSGSDDPRDWRYKRRHAVLGMWHQLKQQLYAEYEERLADAIEVADKQANRRHPSRKTNQRNTPD